MLDGHTFYAYLPGGASGGILPAAHERYPAGLRHAAALWLLHRLGRRSSCCRTTTRAVDAARNLMRFFQRRILRPVHAMPRRHRQGAGAAWNSRNGTCPAGGLVVGDARCLDLRPGPGGAESGRLRDQVFPARTGCSKDLL